MNKKSKIFIFIGLISLYSLFLSKSTGTTVPTLYNGVFPNSTLYPLLVNYFLFSIYSFFIFDSSTKYIQGYGILIVTRSKKRKQLCNKLIIRIILAILFFEIIKILSYFIIFNLNSNVGIHLYILIKDNYFFIMSSILIMTIFLLIQLLLEIKLNSTKGILITQILYISTIFFSDYFYNIEKESFGNLLFLNNFSMKARFELLNFEHYFIGGLYVPILVLIIIYFANIKSFDKKDLL